MSDFDRLMRSLREIKKRQKAEKKLLKEVYSVDFCRDITGYPCSWLITGPEAFEKHLKEKHPEGEHR